MSSPNRIPLTLITLALLMAGQGAAQPNQLVNAFPSLTFTRPILVTHAGDGSNRVFVAQQNGLIRVFPNDSTVTSAQTFLNITAKLSSSSGEEGLLGLAFHPDYETNGYFYVNYTAPSPLRTVIARYSVLPGNPNKADSLSGEVLLEFNQPYSNHNGGMILFGTDGYLYISTGDGGSGGDPQNNAQNTGVLLGKILRIDVDTSTVSTQYGIPPDNPFAGGGGRGEIYAWGLRNPWRFSQDPVTGKIWAGDVGQGSWEEIDHVILGGNYGWRCYEGNSPYNLGGCGPSSQYLFPVKQYSSASPNPECSAVGGYVYRGTRRPDLVGSYIYGDYCSGKIWKFEFDDPGISGDTLLIDSPYSISSFGVDEQGELYICNLNGSIHRFAGPALPAAPPLVDPPDNSTTVPVPAHLVWRAIAGATGYRVEVATDSAFTIAVLDDSTFIDTAAVVSDLTIGTEYFWRVRARAPAGWGPPSAFRRFVTTETVALQVPVPAGWSLVSVPVIVGDLSTPALFPDLSAGAFGFLGSQGYVGRDTLAYGEGYWVKYDSARVLAMAGPPRRSDTVSVSPGWNLVGSLSVPIAAAGVTSLPPGILDSPFYSFTDAYVTADSLSPARGYWVKSSSTGSIVLQGPAVFRSDLITP